MYMYMLYSFSVGLGDDVVAEIPNSAVPTALLTEILLWKEEGCSEMDVIERLRLRTIPDGYQYHTWNYGINIT